MRLLAKSAIRKILPAGTRRRVVAKRLLGVKRVMTGSGSNYLQWIKNYENSPHLNAGKKVKGSKETLISVVLPCYNTPDKYLEPLIESLLLQTYKKWELCVADGSNINERSEAIEQACSVDERIKYKKLSVNKGISGNTNEAIKLATGEYVGFMDHDDILAKNALAEVVDAIRRDSRVDLIYSDEDKISDDGRIRSLPFFKPDWSPDLLLGVNYITHFTVVRRSLINKVGGLRSEYDGAQDYDFILRITEITDSIHHIPKILYHWRLADGSTAKDVGEKSHADTAGRAALSDAVRRRGVNADVIEVPGRPTNYRLKYTLPSKKPLVSIIIPFKDKPDLLKTCVESIIKKSTYDNYEIIMISNNSVEEDTHKLLGKLSKNKKCKVFYWNNPFNYSAINNYGREKSRGKYLILLNNDTEVISEGWIEELVGVASQPGVGAVGPLLYYPDNTIQHAGVVLGMGGMAGHIFRRRLKDEWTDLGLTSWPRNYLAVTGACLAIEVKKYDEVGGLDERFIVAGNDVALGIRLYERGYRNVYWPFAELIHYESISVGSYNNVPESDYTLSLKYYRPYLEYKDPFFNINIDIMNEYVDLRRK